MKMVTALFGVVICLIPLFGFAQINSVVFDFDDLTVPCDLSSAQPLRSEYESRGLYFLAAFPDDGGAAALGDCSGYGVPGYSSPNFAVVDKQSLLVNGEVPDALHFRVDGEAPQVVRINVGGTPGTTINFSCELCPWSFPGCEVYTTIQLGSEMVNLELTTGSSIYDFLNCAVVSPDVVGSWIIDDIEFRYAAQGAEIPTISLTGAAILIFVLAVIGIFTIRRGR